MGLQVLSQADECDEQGRRLKESHVVDVDALLVEVAPVHSRQDRVGVCSIGAQRHQDVHVGCASPQRPDGTRMEVPPNDELRQTYEAQSPPLKVLDGVKVLAYDVPGGQRSAASA